MKTPDANKCGLECIRTNVERVCVKPEKGQCPRCEQIVGRNLELEAIYSQVSKALCGKENATLEEVLRVIDQVTTRTFAIPARSGKTLALRQAQRIADLEKELAVVKRERDAAVKDLKAACKLLWDDCMQCCKFCERKNDPKDTGYCDKCNNGNRFKFKPAALCPKNTEVQTDD